MECMPIHLHERVKTSLKSRDKKPRRYCQRRMVDPEYEDDLRRKTAILSFRFDNRRQSSSLCSTPVHNDISQDEENIYLTVQNLKFCGVEKQIARQKTSFQYKSLRDHVKHRMFVKQPVCEPCTVEDERCSPLSFNYFPNLANYIKQSDRSPTVSLNSSLIITEKTLPCHNKQKKPSKVRVKNCSKVQPESNRCTIDKYAKTTSTPTENKEILRKTDKRKSLVTRTQSPETVQVIRVEILCNDGSSSTISDYNDEANSAEVTVGALECFSIKGTGIANKKYFLSKNTKHQDERVCRKPEQLGFLCKSFKLSYRSTEANTETSISEK